MSGGPLTKFADPATLPPDTRCASCGETASAHKSRHPFTVPVIAAAAPAPKPQAAGKLTGAVELERLDDGTIRVHDAFGCWCFNPRDFDADAALAFLKANRKRFGMARHFRFDHLPPALRFISQQFACLAAFTIAVSAGDPAECAAALRKLKEAKDCAVSAAVPPAEGWE